MEGTTMKDSVIVNNHIIRAWTGGSCPKPIDTISQSERKTCRNLFREQVRDFMAYWGDMPSDVLRIFWNRARFDSHATHRQLDRHLDKWSRHLASGNAHGYE
jgi:hypothetical protein